MKYVGHFAPSVVVAQEAPCSSVGGTCQKASSSDECSGDGDVLLHGHCPSQPECVKCCAQGELMQKQWKTQFPYFVSFPMQHRPVKVRYVYIHFLFVTTARPVQDCLTPTGDDCLWYSGCLEPLRPCAQSDHPYAVGYGDKYCKLYEVNHLTGGGNCGTMTFTKYLSEKLRKVFLRGSALGRCRQEMPPGMRYTDGYTISQKYH